MRARKRGREQEKGNRGACVRGGGWSEREGNGGGGGGGDRDRERPEVLLGVPELKPLDHFRLRVT